MPEGRIPIAQCITYLATAPKSNRSYKAMHAAVAAIKENPKVEVPLHLRNAPTALMKDQGYGVDYQYPHDSADGYLPEIQYLPEELGMCNFYQPTKRGYEKMIAERMAFWKGEGDR